MSHLDIALERIAKLEKTVAAQGRRLSALDKDVHSEDTTADTTTTDAKVDTGKVADKATPAKAAPAKAATSS